MTGSTRRAGWCRTSRSSRGPTAPASRSTLNLFDGGRRLNEIKRTRYDVGAAEANEVTQRFNIALQVKTQYYAILAARESEAAGARAARAGAAAAQGVHRAHRAGVATMSDSLRSVVAVGNAQLALITARNNVRVASAALTRLVGSETLVTAPPSDTLDLALAPIDSASLAGLLDEARWCSRREAQLVSAAPSVRSSRTSYLPTVDLTYQQERQRLRQVLRVGRPAARLHEQLQPSPRLTRSGTTISARMRSARARVQADIAEATVRDARLGAQQKLAQQLGALRTAQAAHRASSRRRVHAAQEDLRVQQQRYALGASTLLDVLTSQTSSTRRAPRSSRRDRISASPARSSRPSSAASFTVALRPHASGPSTCASFPTRPRAAARCRRRRLRLQEGQDGLRSPPQPVQRRDIVIDAQATGVVEPINIVEVKSKASAVRSSKMPVETGTHREAGRPARADRDARRAEPVRPGGRRARRRAVEARGLDGAEEARR